MLGDLVNMPLPTQYAPEVQYQGMNLTPEVMQLLYGSTAASAQPGTVPAAIPAGQPGSQQNITYDPVNGTMVSLPPGTYPGGLTVPPTIGPPGPAPNWHQPILLDSILPDPLKRTNPLLGKQVYSPGYYDTELVREARWWTWVKAHGGLKSVCRLPELGAPIYDQPPWMVMPSNARKLEEGFAVTSPAGLPTGSDVVLGSFQVPEGYDGVITRFVPNFVGTGFSDFSGAIIWRVKVNNRFAPDLGNVNTTYGSLTAGFSVPGINNIRLISGQTVFLIAFAPTGGPVIAGVVSAFCFGWFYPRR